MSEANRFRFDAVHQDNPHTGERIHIHLADRLLHKILPGKFLLIDRRAFICQQVDGHKTSLKSTVSFEVVKSFVHHSIYFSRSLIFAK